MPKLSDPLLFLEFHDAVEENTTLTDKQIKTYQIFKRCLQEPFNHLAWRGDKLLGIICLDVIDEFFGEDNLSLAHLVHDRTVSNTTWKHLAIAYQLDAYVGVKRGTRDKFYADMWEAYWGALFLERQMWNEGYEDLVSFIRVMVFLRNEKVMRDSGAYPAFTFDPTMPTDIFDSRDDHIDVQEVATFDGLKFGGNNPSPLGYCAKYKSTSNTHQLDASCFSKIKQNAISKLKLYCSVPWSTFTSSSCSPFLSLFV